jgi:hypothetical protein
MRWLVVGAVLSVASAFAGGDQARSPATAAPAPTPVREEVTGPGTPAPRPLAQPATLTLSKSRVPIGAYADVLLAQDLGEFAKENLTVKFVSETFVDSLVLVQQGRLDGAVLGFGAGVFNAAAAGPTCGSSSRSALRRRTTPPASGPARTCSGPPGSTRHLGAGRPPRRQDRCQRERPHLVATSRRLFLGLALGLVSWIALGFAMGLSRWLRAGLDPLLSALYVLPKLALFPVLLVIFGVGDTPTVLLVAMTGFMVMAIATEAAVTCVPASYREAAVSLGGRPHQVLRHVLLPASLPQVLVGLRLGAGRRYWWPSAPSSSTATTGSAT